MPRMQIPYIDAIIALGIIESCEREGDKVLAKPPI